MAVLGGVVGKWRDVGMELHVPRRSMDIIASESTSDLQCLMRGTLRYWIRHDPRASWRRLIWRLDWSLKADLNKLSNDIRSYAEKLTGQYYSVVSSYIRMCMLLGGPYAPLHLKKQLICTIMSNDESSCDTEASDQIGRGFCANVSIKYPFEKGKPRMTIKLPSMCLRRFQFMPPGFMIR